MLEPYRVLDLSDEHGLLCGQILADLGADVIAVEPPGGSPARRIGPFADDITDPNRSLYWWSYARNKRSVTLDLENDDGRERLRELVRGADFLIESFDPGYLDRLGIGYTALRALNPRLVMVSVTAFGSEGPKSHYAATDLIALAASGVLLLTGDDDRPPVRCSVPQAFLHAGAEAAVGALIAHFARERDGIGQHVDVSAQTATMIATQCYVLAEAWGDRTPMRIAGGIKGGRNKLKFVYQCEDGYVSVTLMFGSMGVFTKRLFEWMYEEEFVDEATRDKDWNGFWDRVVRREEPPDEMARITEALERFMLSHTKLELFEEAQRRGLLIVPVSTTADLVASEQYRSRGFWTDLEHPELGRPIAYPGPFARFDNTQIHYRRRPPLIGEHNDEVLTPIREPVAALRASAGGRYGPRGGNGAGASAPLASPRRFRPRAFPGAATWDAEFGPPLQGVKIVDLMWVVAGPSGIRSLGDYGATVVHVESSKRPDTLRGIGPYKDKRPGTESSTAFASVNAGKYGLSLNLGSPEGRKFFLRLAAWADVVAESFSPRAMRRWGLGYEELRKVNPRLIMISTCLNGQTGPESNLAGFGTMGAALAGFHELTGWPDRPPAGPFMAYTDYTTPRYVAAALLAALDHRRRTGKGEYIDLSQAECSMHFISPALLDYTVNGRVEMRNGNASAEHAPHGVYPCRGRERWVAIACADDDQWLALCAATGHERWMTDPRFATFEDRQKHRIAIDAVLAAWTANREVREVVLTLQAAGVPAHRVVNSADALRDPQLRFRRHFVTTQHPKFGPMLVESSRLRFSHETSTVGWTGPSIGQHNDYVLRELLGLSDEEIVDLVSAGALD